MGKGPEKTELIVTYLENGRAIASSRVDYDPKIRLSGPNRYGVEIESSERNRDGFSYVIDDARDVVLEGPEHEHYDDRGTLVIGNGDEQLAVCQIGRAA